MATDLNSDTKMERENRLAIPTGVVVFKPDHQKGLQDNKRGGVEDRGAGKATGRSPDFKNLTTGYDAVIS